ncbi:solute carrier family 23 protein [Paenibacillus alkalitolerans]|uniref:solute carrier family 23 protein n=1 Tax=Paenibacillus alkalitolerans TaxID=2799335 RepID=UPI0018F449EE|nr:NCS2 family permease [Paenibacillus alkalitolerans]
MLNIKVHLDRPPEIAASQTGGWLERTFKLKQFNTNVRTEAIAGLTTFITMAYIIIVNPNIIQASGMPVGAVMVSTILVAAIFTIFMGLYAKRPFALAPGMGSNAFFAFTIVAGGMATWQTGLGMVFISGVLFLILTLIGIRDAIANAIFSLRHYKNYRRENEGDPRSASRAMYPVNIFLDN